MAWPSDRGQGRSCEHVGDRGRRAGAGLCAGAAVRSVVTIVAALTPTAQVFVAAIFRLMIEVRDRQHDADNAQPLRPALAKRVVAWLRPFQPQQLFPYRPRLVPASVGISAATLIIRNAAFFAFVAGALADPCRDLRPLRWISQFVFRPDRQATSPAPRDSDRERSACTWSGCHRCAGCLFPGW